MRPVPRRRSLVLRYCPHVCSICSLSSPTCSLGPRLWFFILVIFNNADCPAQDKIPDTSESIFFWWTEMTEWSGAASDKVQTWMEELNGFDNPSWKPTVDGTCLGDPAAVAEASARGWWTCGRTTRDTDTTACPEKLDWASALMTARALIVSVPALVPVDIYVPIHPYSPVSLLLFRVRHLFVW
jgi:hypothetical protein